MVTIQIPTYNQATYIGRAIESALNQTYEDIEVIVSDDASQDNTEDIVLKYCVDPRFKYFRREKNIGRIANYRSTLYEYAKGEWVINLDADDYFIDYFFIENAMDALKSNPDSSVLMICANRYESTDNIPTTINNSYNWQRYHGKDILLNSCNKNRDVHIWHLATLYNREKAISIGFYNKNIISCDQESLFRLLLHGDILYSKKKVAVWQLHNENVSKKLDMKAILENLSEYTSIKEYSVRNSLLDEKKMELWCKKCITKSVEKYLKTFAKTNGFAAASEFYLSSKKAYPFVKKVLIKPKVVTRIALALARR